MTPAIVTKAVQVVKSNSPEILTALGVSGVFSTSYLTGRASVEASDILREHEMYLDMDLKTKVKLVWKCYIPAGVSGALTIGCIIGSSRAASKRTAAAVTAYSLAERAFSEYREKVAEEIGKGKEQKIRDDIVQDKVDKDEVKSREVIIWGSGEWLCCEMYTHRYFRSDMESLRRAENNINHLINNQYYVTLSEFYDEICLPHTSASDKLGWDSNQLMQLQFTSVLSGDGEPCLAFDYNYVKPLR